MSIYQTLKDRCREYNAHLFHPFVQAIADGSLPKAAFRYYLQQDYLFLIQFTRAWGLAIYKSQTMTQLRMTQTAMQASLGKEVALHIEYCEHFGLDAETLANAQEDPATIAYTRYLLDCGHSGPLADLYIAMLPCMLGYRDIACRIKKSDEYGPENPYNGWVDAYSSRSYVEAGNVLQDCLAHLAAEAGVKAYYHWQKLFDTATRMEIAFWQMGLETAQKTLSPASAKDPVRAQMTKRSP